MHIGFNAFYPVVSNLQLQDGLFFALKLDALREAVIYVLAEFAR